MTNDPSPATLHSAVRTPQSPSQFLRDYLLTTLFWGALVCLYLPWHWWLPLLVVLPPLPVLAVSARMNLPSRRTAQVLMLLTVLIAAFYVFCARGTDGLAARLFSSDTLSYPALCQSLIHGEPLSGWVFPAPNFLFPDMAPYFLLNLLVPKFRLSLILFGILQVLAALGVYALLEAAVLPESRNKPLRLFVFVALLAYLAHDGSFLGLGMLLEAGQHAGAVISLLFALWLIFRMIGSERDRRSLLAHGLALFLVTLLTTMSDGLFLAQFVAPAVATLVLMWLFSLMSRRRFALLAAILAAGAMGGRLFYDRFFMRIELENYFALSPSNIAKSLDMVLPLLKGSGGIPILLELLILLSVAACVVTILLHIRRPRLQRAGMDGRMVGLSIFIIFLCLSNLSAILLSSTVPNWYALARYTIPLALLPLLFLATAAQHALKAAAVDISRPVRLALLLVLPLLLVLTVQKSPNFVRLAGYYPKWVSDLDQEFAKRNLKYGMAQYWQAKYLSFFSRDGVQVVQVTPALEPFLWINHRDWYYRPFQFIITDETAAKETLGYQVTFYLDPKRIVSRFGPPDETFTCDSNTVRVYRDGRLHGCFPNYVDLSKPGAEATFLAVQLPGQVGADAGESRVAEGCAAGYVTYGPYTLLYPGVYRGRIDYEAKAASSGQAVGEWDVVLKRRGGKEIVQKGPLSPQSDCVEFEFEVGSTSVAEIRTFYAGAGRLIVHRLTLQRER
jgi:hypothetical protein